jgi:hypothetical protein
LEKNVNLLILIYSTSFLIAIRCEDDWRLALNGFTLGLYLSSLSSSSLPPEGSCLLLVTVALASWVLYWPHPHGYVAAIIVSIICLVTVVYWYTRVYLKWYVALKMVRLSLGLTTHHNRDHILGLQIHLFEERDEEGILSTSSTSYWRHRAWGSL